MLEIANIGILARTSLCSQHTKSGSKQNQSDSSSVFETNSMQGFVSTPHTATPETLPAVTVLKAAFKAALKSDSKIQLCFHCCYTCLPFSF